LALRNSPFEVAVVERVIFDLDGEALIMRIDRRTLGDGPRLQSAVKFEPEIIVKARGGVFLDYEATDLRWRDSILAAGFGGLAKIALGLIRGKFIIRRHEDSLASRYNLPLPLPCLQRVSTDPLLSS